MEGTNAVTPANPMATSRLGSQDPHRSFFNSLRNTRAAMVKTNFASETHVTPGTRKARLLQRHRKSSLIASVDQPDPHCGTAGWFDLRPAFGVAAPLNRFTVDRLPNPQAFEPKVTRRPDNPLTIDRIKVSYADKRLSTHPWDGGHHAKGR